VALALMSGLLYFSHQGYHRAIQHAEDGYTEWAVQNNQFAAQLAAQRVTEELGRCFELARDEADNPDLLTQLTQVTRHRPALTRIENAETPDNELDALQAAFLREPDQKSLVQYLQD